MVKRKFSPKRGSLKKDPPKEGSGSETECEYDYQSKLESEPESKSESKPENKPDGRPTRVSTKKLPAKEEPPAKKESPVKKKPPAKKESSKRVATSQSPSPKKIRIEPFRFKNTDNDPIIENLREVSAKFKQIRCADNEILDHVALEGLTGITFSRLCLIIDAVIPSINACNNDMAQDYVWSVIVKGYMRRVPGASIQVFYLDLTQEKSDTKPSSETEDEDAPEPNKNFCIDKAIKLPNQSLKRIAKSDWMLHPVLDGEIMGSCPNYTNRTNISKEVMDCFNEHGPRESLLMIHSKYDLKNIYFVADQEVRRRMLIPRSFDPNMDIKLREYACLELIGRTRCFGIVFPNDKTLGRYRILLTAKGLITQYQQTVNTFIIHHIRRFAKYNLEFGPKAFKGGLDETIKDKEIIVNDIEDDDDDDLEAGGNATVKATCCNPARWKCDRNILTMVYDTIALSRGRSMADIRRKLRLPKSHVRNHLKNLANTGLIGSHTRVIIDKKTRIYRARHKSKRRRLARKKKSNLKGIRTRWDEADLRAKELLGLKRSHFTQAEDSLITLCRITGLLIDPTFSKSFIVSKRVIRDILHDEIFESHDKTSDALLRRVKYLRRLPSNVALINEITAELRDDPDIQRMVENNKAINSSSTEKLVKFFKQLLRAVRSKLPHLLGMTSGLVASTPIEIEDYDDLIRRFDLIDCRDSLIKKVYHQPQCTQVQLIRSTPQCYRLKMVKCEDMQSVMLISTRCVQTLFNLDMRLKVPVRVVGLDQENEYFKSIFEQVRQSKEASRLIANLTTSNPTADSRRALFMLRNALKLQTMDKCGKLADALVIQPCDIEFSSDEEIIFNGRHALKEFLTTSKFSNEIIVEPKGNDRELLNKRRREKYRKSQQSKEIQQQRLEENQVQIELKGDQGRRMTRSTSSSLIAATSQVDQQQPSTSQTQNRPEEEEGVPQTKQEKLFKMIESIMSWVSTYPGIELESLQKNLEPLLGTSTEEHLNELLELMETLELISRDTMPLPPDMSRKPLLFGYRELTEEEQKPIITFAPRENAYVKLSQLIDVEL